MTWWMWALVVAWAPVSAMAGALVGKMVALAERRSGASTAAVPDAE